MKKLLFILSIVLMLLLNSCQPSQSAKIQKENEMKKAEQFTPPADGKITDRQVEKYILVAKALNNAIAEQVVKMNDFYKKYDITGKEELGKLKDNKKAMDEWNKLMANWEKTEEQVYKKYKMSSEEFDWIASALIENKNIPAQKKIEEALKDTTPKFKDE